MSNVAIDNTALAEQVLKKAHVRLLRHRKTYLYSGVLLLGDSIVDDSKGPTACTDGLNKYYNSKFLASLGTISKVSGLVLHEALHVFLKQLQRHKDLWDEDRKLANAAADYVVNAIIKDIENEDRAALAAANNKADPVVTLPDGGLYDAKFINWSMRQVYDFLKQAKEADKPQPQDDEGKGKDDGNKGDKGDTVSVDGKEYKLDTLDEHDTSGVDVLTDEEVKEMTDKIDAAIQEAGLLAGLSSQKLPRAVQELFEVEPCWRDVMQEFFNSHARGNSEYTFSKFNRRRIIDEIYRPHTYNEKLGRVVLAVDTSASISQAQISQVINHTVSLCEQCSPDELLVLWWDTSVHGEQRFSEESFSNLRHALKPVGFGGTRAGCVSEYLTTNNIHADCIVMFTDGYVEDNVKWEVSAPTLWVVKGNERFVPPAAGKIVKFK